MNHHPAEHRPIDWDHVRPEPARERQVAPIDVVIRVLWLIAWGSCCFALFAMALRQSEVADALCSTDTQCYERYCAQDLSCDGGPEVVP